MTSLINNQLLYDAPARLHDAPLPVVLQKQRSCRYPFGHIQNLFSVYHLAHRQRLPGFSKQLIWLFIHTYHRNRRIIRHLIDVKDILHAGYEFCIFFRWDTPVGIFVRSKFIFFKVVRMVSLPIGTSSSIRAFSSRSRMVQRECPSGTGPQAI